MTVNCGPEGSRSRDASAQEQGGGREPRTPDWKLRRVDDFDPALREALLAVEHTDIGSGRSHVPIGRSPDESPAADVSGEHPDVVAQLTALHEQ